MTKPIDSVSPVPQRISFGRNNRPGFCSFTNSKKRKGSGGLKRDFMNNPGESVVLNSRIEGFRPVYSTVVVLITFLSR